MKSLLKIALIVTLICFSSASSKAQVTVVPGVDAGLPMPVSNFRSNATGLDTVGAMVRVWYRNHYSGVRSDTAIVLSPAAGQGIAEGGVNPYTGGPLWRLSITGDTASAPWLFEGLSAGRPVLFEIARVQIDLLPSQTAFDRVSLLGLNTPGTMGGITFANGGTTTPGVGPDYVNFRYGTPLFLPAMGAPSGDVFGVMDLKFYDALLRPGGFGGSSWIEFDLDTDRFVR